MTSAAGVGSAQAGADLSSAAIAVGLLLAAWTSVMLPGFVFPYSNNIFHVPIVLGYAGSPEGPSDAFTQSLDRFVSGVWPALALIATERNVFWVFFAAHLAARLLFVAGVYALIRHFAAARPVALALAALAALAPIFKVESVVGRNDVLTYYFTHTELAMAISPGCWWLLVRGRWIAGGAAIGLMFNVNAFLAIWSALAALVAFLAVRAGVEQAWRRLLLCGLACAATALPTAVWTLLTVLEPSPKIEFRAFLLSYYPFHTFIHVQWDRVIRYLAYLIAALLAVTAALRHIRGRGATVLAALLATFGAMFLLGAALPYLSDSRLLLNLYPLRLDSVVNLVIAAIMLAWAGQELSRPAAEQDRLPLAMALTLLVGNMAATLLLLHLRTVRQGQPTVKATIPIALAAVVTLLLAADSPPELSKGFIPIILIFCGIALCAAFGAARAAGEGGWIGAITVALVCSVLPELPDHHWLLAGLGAAVTGALVGWRWAGPMSFIIAVLICVRLAGAGDLVAFLAAVALTATGLLLATPRAATMRRLASLAAGPAMLLAGIGAIGAALSGHALWRGTVERADMDSSAEREAQLWARAHVPPHTALLAVGVDGFGILSRRPIWLDRKAGAAVMWDPAYLAEWQARADALDRCGDSSCYAALARRHGLGWVVTTPGRLAQPGAAGLALRFRNQMYEIYSVNR